MGHCGLIDMYMTLYIRGPLSRLSVMAGLVQAIPLRWYSLSAHPFDAKLTRKAWMAGTSPAMTTG